MPKILHKIENNPITIRKKTRRDEDNWKMNWTNTTKNIQTHSQPKWERNVEDDKYSTLVKFLRTDIGNKCLESKPDGGENYEVQSVALSLRV